MKTFFAFIAFTSLAISAQAGLKTTTLNGGTNFIAASATSNYTTQAAISVTSSRFVGIVASFKLVGGGTTDCGFSLDRSVDNSTWKTNVGFFTVTPSGTNLTLNGTNLDTGGFAYWRIGTITNGSASAMTNLTIKYYFKTGI